MEKVSPKDALLTKQCIFQFILWMSGFIAVCLAIVFIAFLFVPNSGTAPDGVIFGAYLILAAMPIGFFGLYKWCQKKVRKIDIELGNWQKIADEDRRRAERKSMLPILAVVIAIACLIVFGLKACGGDYTRCPKCGSLYDTGNGGANYIDKYGKCAKCDYGD